MQATEQRRTTEGRTNLADAQARKWLAQLHSGRMTAQDRTRFEAWLGADAGNPKAYRRAEQIWRDVSLIDGLGEVSLERPGFTRRLFSRPVLALAASVTLCVGLGLTAMFLRPAGDRFATQTAEVRELTLPDGSRVTLGARSVLSLDFTADTRRVRLDSGEAFFSVVRDPKRPFFVAAGDAQVRVLGTQFDVRHGAQGIRVAVGEGTVEVVPAVRTLQTQSPDRGHLLTAGQELFALKSFISVRKVDKAEPGAWRRGRLSYENTNLAEVIADANRYSAHEISFASAGLRDVRVTTAFRTDQIDEMLDGLAATHPIVVERTESGRIVLHRAP